MNSLSRFVRLRRSADNERGQGMAEYIIIVILVAIIVLGAIKIFGKSVYNQFTNAKGDIYTLESSTP